jgi:hypothetical protein
MSKVVDYDKTSDDPEKKRGGKINLLAAPDDEEEEEEGGDTILDPEAAEKVFDKYKLLLDFQKRIDDHYDFCKRLGLPCKFLITYDSFKHLHDRLGSRLQEFYVVIDEFQSVFLDSYFKSETELSLVDYLSDCENLMFLSATPMLEEYLARMDEFKDLPFYKLVWPENYVEKAFIRRKEVKSLFTDIGRIIQDYKKDKFPIKVLPDGSVHQSKELVIFCNSVTTITQIIKRNKLRPEEVNVICSKTSANETKLRNAGIKGGVGKIPLRGAPHKMFTFCTRTTYLGADFYSTCASTIILSDANIDSLALDIALDLPQIIGRQRLPENVFKNEATIFYRLKGDKKLTEERFFKRVAKKVKSTETLLRGYTGLPEDTKPEFRKTFKRSIKAFNYKNDYIGISNKTGEPQKNKLVMIAEERAWKVSQVDYQDNITVTRTLKETCGDDMVGAYKSPEELEVAQFMIELDKDKVFTRRMQLYCDFRDAHSGDQRILMILRGRLSDVRLENYYNYYGSARIKSLKYRNDLLVEGIKDKIKSDPLAEKIYLCFVVGGKYTLKDIKEKLKVIYADLGIYKSPKAKDLLEYFYSKDCKIGKDRAHGYELTGFRRQENIIEPYSE